MPIEPGSSALRAKDDGEVKWDKDDGNWKKTSQGLTQGSCRSSINQASCLGQSASMIFYP